MSRIEEIQKRRAARKAALNELRLEQFANDLEQLDALELEHGDGKVVPHHISDDDGNPARFVEGCVTMAIFRLPTKAEMRRYQDKCKPDRRGRPGDTVAAANQIATACRLYPDKDGWELLIETYPGMETNAAVSVLEAVSGVAEEEGKG